MKTMIVIGVMAVGLWSYSVQGQQIPGNPTHSRVERKHLKHLMHLHIHHLHQEQSHLKALKAGENNGLRHAGNVHYPKVQK